MNLGLGLIRLRSYGEGHIGLRAKEHTRSACKHRTDKQNGTAELILNGADEKWKSSSSLANTSAKVEIKIQMDSKRFHSGMASEIASTLLYTILLCSTTLRL